MAQSGFTPILLYASGTASAAPSAGNLTSSASGAELALNYADGKLFYKDSGGVVQTLATKATGTIGGSTTQVQYNNGGVLAGSANLTFDGTSLTLGGNPTLSAGTANGVLYLNGSKVATSGSALTYNGSTLANSGAADGTNAITATGSTVGGFIALRPDGTNGQAIRVGGSGAAADTLRFLASGDAEYMRLNSTGLGIGAAPTAKLDVVGGNGDGLQYRTGTRTVGVGQVASEAAVYWGSGTALTFFSGLELMRLTSTGLGIGTSSPATKLDVNGAAVVRGTFTPTDAITMGGNTSAPTADAFIYRPANNTLAFGTANTERARLDSSGNLGLGVTPSAWAASARTIDFAFPSVAMDTTGAAVLGFNAYNSSGTTWNYRSTDEAALFTITNAGAFTWRQAASGTAGNAISFTQAMTLDASGSLGVGETSPGSYSKFVVQNSSASLAFFYRTSSAGLSIAADNDGPYLSTNAYHNLRFFTNSTERARITSAGNLGIGTSSPVGKLDVRGSLYVDTDYAYVRANNTLERLRIGTDGANDIYLPGVAPLNISGEAGLAFITNGSERVRLNTIGQVGIGTSSPTNKLDVFGGGSGIDTRVSIRNTAANLQIGIDSSNNALISTSTATSIIFNTNNTERARITSTGNVVAGGSVALATTATNGFLYVPTCAGTPTGTPTTITGMAPIVVNTTNNKLYFYSGGAWRDAGP